MLTDVPIAGKTLESVQLGTTEHKRVKFLNDLRKARENDDRQAANAALAELRPRLDDPGMMSNETVYAMLLSYRYLVIIEQLDR